MWRASRPPPGPPSPCCPRTPRPATSPRSSSASRCVSPSSPGRSACRRSAPACLGHHPYRHRQRADGSLSRQRAEGGTGCIGKKRLASSAPPGLRVLPASFPRLPALKSCRNSTARTLPAARGCRAKAAPAGRRMPHSPGKKPPSRAGKRAVASDRMRQA